MKKYFIFPTMVKAFIFMMVVFFNSSTRAQLIRFDTTTFYFDQIKKGDKAECEFKFSNTDKQYPLSILKVTPSCGCMVVDYPKEPIKPGQTGVIKVKYDTQRTGVFSKTIYVLAPDLLEDKYTVLTIKGEVVGF